MLCATAPVRRAGAPTLWQLARSFPVTGPQPLSSLRRAGNRASRPGHRVLARSSLLRDWPLCSSPPLLCGPKASPVALWAGDSLGPCLGPSSQLGWYWVLGQPQANFTKRPRVFTAFKRTLRAGSLSSSWSAGGQGAAAGGSATALGELTEPKIPPTPR